MVLSFEDWHARLAGHPQAKHLTGSLVWRILDGSGGSASVLPVGDQTRLVLQDVCGRVLSGRADGPVILWHPSDVSADERDGWRDRIAALRIRQPFKQVFREHYVVSPEDLLRSETAMFAGHAVSIRPFLGLARREGWQLHYDHLARSIGDVTVTVILADRVFPRATGWTTVQTIRVWVAGARKYIPARLDDLSAVARSEMLRSVDLLVSTSGFALTSAQIEAQDDPHRDAHLRSLAERPLGPMAEMRRTALERALAGRAGLEGMHFDARHLRLGPYAVHLATGRVTRNGDPVTIALPERAEIASVPWLPYDERLLEVIAVTALQIGAASRIGDCGRRPFDSSFR